MNYFNENDPFTAAWLRELIKADCISQGEVDERSIEDVQPGDLKGFKQCHFFAGIGVWSYALRCAGWGDDRKVWTGSCPCQPFSIANVAHGGGKGQADSRHLLPKFCELITERRPDVVIGEQVTNAIRWGWADELLETLEAIGYACGPIVLPACAFGADHERKRLFWLAYSGREGRSGHQPVECLLESASASLSFTRNNFLRARRVMDHDYESVLPCDGTSVVMERSALTGYGNSLVAPQAEEFVRAAMEVLG